MKGKVDCILGLQWGDCGKGKIIDEISGDYDIVARFNGSDNAGHSIVINGRKHVLHLVPSGIFRQNCINIIGNGCLVNPISLLDEISKLESIGIDVKSHLYISKRAHLILPTHRLLDKSSEISKGKDKIGSTLKGIGPTYMDKTGRNGIRVGDIFDNLEQRVDSLTNKHILLMTNIIIDADQYESEIQNWFKCVEKLKEYNIIDSEYYINQALVEGKSVLAEGAQGTLLDVDFGSYPYVTSSNTTISGVISGLGIAPTKIENVTGIFKAYTTRVGSGPFPTELDNEIGEDLRRVGNEYGATTGRERRCGWLDLPLLEYACMINGVTELNIMKIDVLSHLPEIQVCTGYVLDGDITEQVPFDLSVDFQPIYETLKGWRKDISGIKEYKHLPKECRYYIEFVEKWIKIPITRISVGPDRNQTINK
jgi:adenylosuccinate synthase